MLHWTRICKYLFNTLFSFLLEYVPGSGIPGSYCNSVFNVHTVFYSSCLLWRGFLVIRWTEGVGEVILALFMIFEEMLSTFHHWVMLAVGFSYLAITMFRYFPYFLFIDWIQSIWYMVNISWKRVEFCQMLFSFSWNDHFPLHSVDVLYYIDFLSYVVLSLCSRNKNCLAKNKGI